MNQFKCLEKRGHSLCAEELCVELVSRGSSNAYTDLSKAKLNAGSFNSCPVIT